MSSNVFASISTALSPRYSGVSPLRRHSKSPVGDISPRNTQAKTDSGLRKTDWEESDFSAYESLLTQLISHYQRLEATHYHAEIAFLQSLYGSINADNVSAFEFLPKLSPDLKIRIQALASRKRPPVDPSESQLNSVLELMNPRLFESFRCVNRPSGAVLRVVGAFLALFSRVDAEIEVTTGLQVVMSRVWETWREYVRKPGRVVQTARKVAQLVRQGTISSSDIREAKAIFGESAAPSESGFLSEATEVLSLYLTAVFRFHAAITPRRSLSPCHRPLSSSSPRENSRLSPSSPIKKPEITMKIPSVSPKRQKENRAEGTIDIEKELEKVLRAVIYRKISSEELVESGVDAIEAHLSPTIRYLWAEVSLSLMRKKQGYIESIGETEYENALRAFRKRLNRSDFLRKAIAKAARCAKKEQTRKKSPIR